MRLRLQLILALIIGLLAGPTFAQEGLDLLGVDNGVVTAAAPTGPSVLANGTTGSVTSNTFTSSGGVSCPAGAVAQAAMLTQGSFPSSFKDNVDPSTSWANPATGGPSNMDMRIFQRVVPAGGFNGATTFAVVWGGTASSSALVVTCIPGATSLPANSSNTDATSTSITAAVPGTTFATSWQVAFVGANIATGATKDGASDPSWTAFSGGSNVNGNGWGVLTFWRQAASTAGPNNLIVDTLSTSFLSAVWGEAKP